jgi:hypothetical protein
MSDVTTDAPVAAGNETTNGAAAETTLQPYVLDALGDDFDVSTLTPEQLDRATSAPTTKGGLRGTELRRHIMEGDEARKAARKSRSKAKKDGKGTGRGGRGGTRAIAKGHPEWVGSATTRAKALSAQKPGLGADDHVPAAGPVQHLKVRHIVEEDLKKENKAVTAENVLEIAGGVSLAQLKKIATFQSDKASLKPLRALGARFDKDGWAKGRYLASILYVWVEDLRKSERGGASPSAA